MSLCYEDDCPVQFLKNRVKELETVEVELKRKIKECINAIGNGQQKKDGRGLVYSQEFGEGFLKHLKKGVVNV